MSQQLTVSGRTVTLQVRLANYEMTHRLTLASNVDVGYGRPGEIRRTRKCVFQRR